MADSRKMIPLNVKELYGDKYKTVNDDASPQSKDPWYFQVLCQYGHIYPVSDKLLGFFCESGGIVAKLHRAHPEIPMPQRGDGEAVFAFTVEQFDLVAKYAKPRKRRRLSEEARQAGIERLRDYQFASRKHAVQTTTGGENAQTQGK